MPERGCIDALKAISEERRVRILRLLYGKQLSVGEICAQLRESQYNVSKRLRIMRKAGLLEVQRHGQQRLYRVPTQLRASHPTNGPVLELTCCRFNLDRL